MKRPTPKQRQKRYIHIAVPTEHNVMGDGVVPFVSSLDRSSMDPANPYRFSWEKVHMQRPVEYARNKLVTTFLRQTDAERLWFIDTDMVVPENALKLLESDADIVAPITFAFDHARGDWTAGLKLCLFKYDEEKQTFHSIVPADGAVRYVDIEAAGTAAMLIKRHVLEDRRMWLDPHYTDLKEQPAVLDLDKDVLPIFRNRYAPNGEILRGEDLDFCLRAHRLGYRIVGDLGVRFGHLKIVDLDHVAQFANTLVQRLARNLQVKPNVGVANESQMDNKRQRSSKAPAGDDRRRTGSLRPSVDRARSLRRGVRHPQHEAEGRAAAGDGAEGRPATDHQPLHSIVGAGAREKVPTEEVA